MVGQKRNSYKYTNFFQEKLFVVSSSNVTMNYKTCFMQITGLILLHNDCCMLLLGMLNK